MKWRNQKNLYVFDKGNPKLLVCEADSFCRYAWPTHTKKQVAFHRKMKHAIKDEGYKLTIPACLL